MFRYICSMVTTLTIKQAERISKALGDPYRLKIMEIVSGQNNFIQCCDLLSGFDLAQSTMSHHLKQLVDAELLISEKDGRNLKFIVNKDVCQAYKEYINSFLG